ncbi:type 4a pilus biogenesis protein PilO [Candidatus Magnetominusculus xianensis]|uniref:Uncharacterized protein n=1 Tax=Candidatus Magnetominusculus xianensis TaxID=1748249 RepID=A0ABR5SC81_9BACT|nr:type 4a pilus biogenesis protein PilO [Candidatus Magnetominusculus xianensis]KWT75616.1 hypothetical protein ASN18_3216 [Candidatus Magnetominusculus xianensis]MBF0403699.1 type 4a pilus biogenesis protein PilO [Nitrospirota bacterium]
MIKKYDYIFTRQLAMHVLLYVIGIMIVLLLGILPNTNKMLQLDSIMNTVQGKIEERNALLPTYQQVSAVKKQQMTLPMPERKPIARDQMESVIKIFKETATASGLKVKSVIPDINSIKKDSRTFVLIVKIAGEYDNLRTFLLNTAKLPYVDGVSGITINNENFSKELLFDMRVDVLAGK